MLATFALELGAALYVYMKYKASLLQRLSIVTLLLLATFQLAEYNVCGRFGIDSLYWSKLGYVAITMLPPLGLHIVYALGKRAADRTLYAAYASGAVFSSLFAFADVFSSYACGGNYVIFQLRNPVGGFFFVYYYFWLFAAAITAVQLHKKRNIAKNRKAALVNMVLGYALFIIPASASMLLFPETAAALPSVMCGFAVLFALMLTFRIVPLTEKSKLHAKS